MNVCPKCTSLRMRNSKAQTKYEIFLQNRLGYRFYRCLQCGWRGKEKQTKKPVSSKMSIWKILGIYALVAFVVLFVAIEVVGVGGATR